MPIKSIEDTYQQMGFSLGTQTHSVYLFCFFALNGYIVLDKTVGEFCIKFECS